MLKKYYLSLTTRVFISSYWSDFRDLYYNLEIIKLCYNEGFKIEKELKRHHKVLYISTHGTTDFIEIKVNNYSSANSYFYVHDYLRFIKENGIPALFMDTFHCGDKEAFWIPYSLGGGVWAYYTMWGSFWYIKRERSAATLWYMAFTKRFH